MHGSQTNQRRGRHGWHRLAIVLFSLFAFLNTHAQPDTIVLHDLQSDPGSPAHSMELTIPSGNSRMAAMMYAANGSQRHPTLLLLHGYPGNERNLDLAQVVRTRGWNVIYFNYRGSWGSEGAFSFNNCVEDVVNVVAFCKKYSDSLRIDTSRIALFGHSMGGWVCLKALQRLPGIKKGFVLSAWNIGEDFRNVHSQDDMMKIAGNGGDYFVLHTTLKDLYMPVMEHQPDYDLVNDAALLAGKEIVMLDEHHRNEQLANKIRSANHAYFDYQVWQTDHPFTNKRVSLMNRLIAFLESK